MSSDSGGRADLTPILPPASRLVPLPDRSGCRPSSDSGGRADLTPILPPASRLVPLPDRSGCRPSSRPGRFLVFTGEGKGKSTAALGMALRASGHGMRVLVLQFIKSRQDTGEVMACRALSGVEIVVGGLGFVPPPDDPGFEDHRVRAEETLARAHAALQDGGLDLLILDEILNAVEKGLLSEPAALDLAERRRDVCLVMTGRGAPRSVIERADTVTEMRCLRHAYHTGVPAEPGVEW